MDRKEDETHQDVANQATQSQSRLSQKRTPKTIFIATDEFKQQLLKYANRHARNGRDFALVSVELANFETLSEYARKEDLAHTMNTVRAIAARTARNADRIATLSQAMLLLLLPDTSIDGAGVAISRLQQELMSNIRSLAQIRPVFTFRVSASEGGSCELQEMLSRVGCNIDEHGELVTKGQTRSVLMLGSLDSWKERFHRSTGQDESDSTYKAKDLWSSNEVQLDRIELVEHAQETGIVAGSQMPCIDCNQLVQRARSLQQLDSLSMQRLLDFFINQGKELFLAREERASLALGECKKNFSASQLLEVTIDFATVLIQAHSLIPHLTIQFKPEFLRYDKHRAKLQITDFHVQYLFPQVHSTSGEDCNISIFAEFLEYLVEGRENEGQEEETKEVENGIKNLLRQMKSQKLPESLNTIHKIRTQLRKWAHRSNDAKADDERIPTVGLGNA
jgi:hypothetical protein